MDVVSSWSGPPFLQSPRHSSPAPRLLFDCHLDLNSSFALKDIVSPLFLQRFKNPQFHPFSITWKSISEKKTMMFP